MKLTLRVMILGFCLAARAWGDDMQELFERARALQASNQNLTEAIRLYAQVVAQAKSQRALAAQAQYREGILYQRLGRRGEARQAFQAVIRDFPDQAAVVKLARSRLPANALPPVAANRAVWTGQDVEETSAPSPDGQLLAFLDWKTGALRLRDITSSETRTITRTGGTSCVFSHDGRKIAYTRYDVSPDITEEVRIVGTDGAGERVIFHDGERFAPLITDWSPDGKYLLAFIGRLTVPRQLFLVNVATGARRALRTIGNTADRALFSADGTYVVYETHIAGQQFDDIYTVPLDGSPSIPLVQHPANDELVGWAPGGKRLVFVTDRSGVPEIWGVPVKAGRADGEAQMIRREPFTGDVLGLTKSGTLFYAMKTGQSDVFTAEINPESKTVISAPKPLSQRFVGAKGMPVWSADGQSIIYMVARSEKPQLVIAAADGRERDVFPKLADLYQLLRAHPDGHTVFLKGTGLDGSGGVFRVSLDDGSVQFIAGIGDRPAWSADARILYHSNGRDTLFARDSLTEQVREVYRHPSAPLAFKNPNTAVSPDGKQLAVTLQGVPPGKDSLGIVPESGGPPAVLFALAPSEPNLAPNTLAWTPDGKYILAMRNRPKASELWRFSVPDGTPERLPLTVNGAVRCMRLNPDGRRIAFLTFRDDQEIWALENFLPQDK